VIAEALALGTPLVALTVGGPLQIALSWPSQLSRMVKPTTPRRTACALAEVVEELLATSPAVSRTVISPSTSFAASILSAYESAKST
jgi:hypothetical protein